MNFIATVLVYGANTVCSEVRRHTGSDAFHTQLYFSHMGINTKSPVVSHLSHSHLYLHVFKLLLWLNE